MSKIEWNVAGSREFETGVDRGVFYPQAGGKYEGGVAWDGLIAITESPEGAEPTKLYASNGVHAVLLSNEEYKATIEAYMYPDAFAECNGEATIVPGVKIGQQTRKSFGFCYRTLIGNDLEGTDAGYKIHLVYGAVAAPSERTHNTVNDSPEAETMSWEITTTPVEVPNFKPTATFEINSTTIDKEKLTAIEAVLYGTDEAEPKMPLPAELLTLLGVTEEGTEG